jgi:hypothetical protein
MERKKRVGLGGRGHVCRCAMKCLQVAVPLWPSCTGVFSPETIVINHRENC